MKLTYSHTVKREEHTRSSKDRRYKVISVLCSYTGEDGHEYRKKFESKQEPIIPQTGTHEQINQYRTQY